VFGVDSEKIGAILESSGTLYRLQKVFISAVAECKNRQRFQGRWRFRDTKVVTVAQTFTFMLPAFSFFNKFGED